MSKTKIVSREKEQLTAIGRAFRIGRLDQKLQIQQVEKSSGVSSVTIGKLEKGQLDNCSLQTLNKIGTALGLKITFLIETK